MRQKIKSNYKNIKNFEIKVILKTIVFEKLKTQNES